MGSGMGSLYPEYLGAGRVEVRNEQFWVIVNRKGTICWIRADLLRSRQAFFDHKG